MTAWNGREFQTDFSNGRKRSVAAFPDDGSSEFGCIFLIGGTGYMVTAEEAERYANDILKAVEYSRTITKQDVNKSDEQGNRI